MAFSSMYRTTLAVWVAVVLWGMLTDIVTQSAPISGMNTNLIWPPTTSPAVHSISDKARAVLEIGWASAKRSVG